MTPNRALEMAAGAWTTEDTSEIEIDHRLCGAFADILLREVNGCEMSKQYTIDGAKVDINRRELALSRFQFCINRVAEALGNVCCGGVDSPPEDQMKDPHSTTRVLVDAIEKLKQQVKEAAQAATIERCAQVCESQIIGQECEKEQKNYLDGVEAELRGNGDRAYCDYIEQMKRDTCLGVEYKLKHGTFGQDNLDAFMRAAELLGRHKAFHEATGILSAQSEAIVLDCANVCINMSKARCGNGLENALRVEDKRCADAIIARYGLIDEINGECDVGQRQLCCTDWDNCKTSCIPRAEYWKERAEYWEGRAERAEADNDYLLSK